MSIFIPLQEVEQSEEQLRSEVNALPETKKKAFYKAQTLELKDPDTYATLNYFLVGGFHHFYLGNLRTFAIELGLLVMSILVLIFANDVTYYDLPLGLIFIIALSLYELPQLFFSQKIARLRNLAISQAILSRVNSSEQHLLS